jgi:hypothetical protein
VQSAKEQVDGEAVSVNVSESVTVLTKCQCVLTSQVIEDGRAV